MKRILLILLLFVGLGASAQITTQDRLRVTNGMRPPLDTTAIADTGSISYKGGDIWKKKGDGHWYKVGTGDTASLSARIDQRVKYSDSLTGVYMNRSRTLEQIDSASKKNIADSSVNRRYLASNGLIIGNSTIADNPYPAQLGIHRLMLYGCDSLGGSTINNQAVPGNTIAQQQAIYLADANKATYEWVIIEIGLNDIYNNFSEPTPSIIGRFQSFVDSIKKYSTQAIIIVSTMTPCKQRWIDLLGPSDGAIAQQKWIDMNNAYMGLGDYKIIGVDFRVNKHTIALDAGNGDLAAVYNSGDNIHENNAGRVIIASAWREILQQFGYLKCQTNTPITNYYTPAQSFVGNIGINIINPVMPITIATPVLKDVGIGTNIASFGSGDGFGHDLAAYIRMIGGPTGSDRGLTIESYENGVGSRNLGLQNLGGNVGIGTLIPVVKLDVNGFAAATTPDTIENSRVIATTQYVKLLRDALNEKVVHIDGAETIIGQKTFSNATIFQENTTHLAAAFFSSALTGDTITQIEGNRIDCFKDGGVIGGDLRLQSLSRRGVIIGINIDTLPSGIKLFVDGVINSNNYSFIGKTESFGATGNYLSSLDWVLHIADSLSRRQSNVDTTTRNTGLTNYGRSIYLADSIANKRINDSLALLGTIGSGTYTPTLTNNTNITASALNSAMYTRVGNIIHVSLNVNITPTVGVNTNTVLYFTVPISGMTGGSGVMTAGGDQGYGVCSSQSSTTAQLVFSAQGTGSGTYYVQFDYTL